MKEPANDPRKIQPVGWHSAVGVISSRREVSGIGVVVDGESGAEISPVSEELTQFPPPDAPEHFKRDGSGRVKCEIK
jgi:hypothetical protein